MRPLKLTVSAFGSYAEKQEIDFDVFGESGSLPDHGRYRIR